jgi:hypothetical protein
MVGFRALTYARANAGRLPPLAYLASFYALVSLHYQIPIYLLYSSALSLVGLLVLNDNKRQASCGWSSGVAIFCIVIGVTSHAAKPHTAALGSVLRGERNAPAVHCDIARLGLRIESGLCDSYRRLLQLIAENATQEETILALPVNPELYFLSGRKSALWFFNSALALQNEEQQKKAEERLLQAPPALVFYRESDKYNTPQARALMQLVRSNLDPLGTIEGFEVYQRRADGNRGQD